jgi:hypothetical protein
MVSPLHTMRTVRAATVSAPGRLPRSAALDGICVVRTSVQADGLDASQVVCFYKAHADVDRGFRGFRSGPTCSCG